MRVVVDFAHGHGEDSVGHHPRHDHVRTYGLVVVLLGLGLADTFDGDFEAVSQVAESFVVARVDVELLRGHFEFDRVALAADGSAEVRVDDVIAFGAPGNVVGVAEGVDLEGTDVGGEESEILPRGCEHVPWVEVEEGHEEVQADRGGSGDNKVGEDVVTHGI